MLFRVERTRAVIARTPHLLDLAGSVPVPSGKRGTAWDEVLRQNPGGPGGEPALAAGEDLLLADRVLAECVYVLESSYEVPRERVAELKRAAIALPAIKTVDATSLLRALEADEVHRLDFAEAYLVAQAEATGVGTVLSYDKTIDRVDTVTRREPQPTSIDRASGQRSTGARERVTNTLGIRCIEASSGDRLARR